MLNIEITREHTKNNFVYVFPYQAKHFSLTYLNGMIKAYTSASLYRSQPDPPSFYPSIHACIYLRISVHRSQPDRPSIYLEVCVHLSAYLCIYLPISVSTWRNRSVAGVQISRGAHSESPFSQGGRVQRNA